MKFTLEINCDNAAFEGDSIGYEISRILRKLVAKFEFARLEAADEGVVMDTNGNKVGFWELFKEADEIPTGN
jgi:hypothetical protein